MKVFRHQAEARAAFAQGEISEQDLQEFVAYDKAMRTGRSVGVVNAGSRITYPGMLGGGVPPNNPER